jgi:hypothetical protein
MTSVMGLHRRIRRGKTRAAGCAVASGGVLSQPVDRGGHGRPPRPSTRSSSRRTAPAGTSVGQSGTGVPSGTIAASTRGRTSSGLGAQCRHDACRRGGRLQHAQPQLTGPELQARVQLAVPDQWPPLGGELLGGAAELSRGLRRRPTGRWGTAIPFPGLPGHGGESGTYRVDGQLRVVGGHRLRDWIRRPQQAHEDVRGLVPGRAEASGLIGGGVQHGGGRVVIEQHRRFPLGSHGASRTSPEPVGAPSPARVRLITDFRRELHAGPVWTSGPPEGRPAPAPDSCRGHQEKRTTSRHTSLLL